MKKSVNRSFGSLLLGNLTKKQAVLYLTVYLSIYYLFILISYLLFIQYQPYSMLSRFISHLGMPGENPNGYFFFSLASVWNGLFFFPLNIYFYKMFIYDISYLRDFKGKKHGLCKSIHIFSKFSIIFGFLSSFGTLIIGMFFQDFSSDDSNIFHMIGVFFSFGGIYFGIFSTFMVLLLRKILKLSFPSDYLFFLYHLQFLIESIIFLVVGLMNRTDPGVFSVYFWEWMTIFSVSIWIIGLMRDMPDRNRLMS